MNRNREFVIEYLFATGKDYDSKEKSFRTMKHFHDWFNSLERTIIIIGITERAGDPRYDKYFKEDSNWYDEIGGKNLLKDI